MIGSSGASLVTGAMICAPRTGCEFMIIRSSRFSRSCFRRTASGTPILPTSWSRPPHSRASSSASLTRMTRPMSIAISLTRWLCRAVYGSRLSTASAKAPIVWVNISRISTDRCDACRVVYRGKREQKCRPPLDRVDDRHQPPKRSQGKAAERRLLTVARDNRAKRLAGPKCEQQPEAIATLRATKTAAPTMVATKLATNAHSSAGASETRVQPVGPRHRRLPAASPQRDWQAIRTRESVHGSRASRWFRGRRPSLRLPARRATSRQRSGP